jgi:hypothetical protein
VEEARLTLVQKRGFQRRGRLAVDVHLPAPSRHRQKIPVAQDHGLPRLQIDEAAAPVHAGSRKAADGGQAGQALVPGHPQLAVRAGDGPVSDEATGTHQETGRLQRGALQVTQAFVLGIAVLQTDGDDLP